MLILTESHLRLEYQTILFDFEDKSVVYQYIY